MKFMKPTRGSHTPLLACAGMGPGHVTQRAGKATERKESAA
jgi:hypothetical protein